MYLSKIRITLRKSILDPQGKAVEHSFESLGYKNIKDTRIGKYIELKIEASSEEDARNTTNEVCKKLLANPIIEDFEFEVIGMNGNSERVNNGSSS